MITLSQVYQYASSNHISEDTDIFIILSKMALGYEVKQKTPSPHTPMDSHIEWSTDDVLALFST